MRKLKFSSLILLTFILILTSCGQKKTTSTTSETQPTTVEKTQTKETKEVKKETRETKETAKETTGKKPDVTGSIASYYQHGDHWHITLSNGDTMITSKDPRKIFPKEAFLNATETTEVITTQASSKSGKTVVSWYKHGDHWHLVYSDGSEGVSYTDPSSSSNTSNHTSESIVHTENKVTPIVHKSELFDKVIDHKDHIHVWVNNVEYVLSRELYDTFVREKKFDEVRARGLDGLYYDQIQSKQLKEEVEYIAKAYGVKLEAIRVSDSYFSFNDPSHEYDPTHIHPFFVSRKLFYIPEKTGIPELDFENELISVAYRSQIPVPNMIVRNNRFVLPHGNHDHFVNILTEGGYEAYMQNKKPSLSGTYVQGELNEQTVLDKVNQLKQAVNKKYTDRLENRRVMRLLEEFEYLLKKLKANSTEGYLNILQNFEDVYLTNKKTDIIADDSDAETVKMYQDLLQTISLKNDYFFKKLFIDKEVFIAEVNMNSNEKEKLYEYTYKMKEYTRFDGRIAIVGLGYVKYLTEQFEDPKVAPSLKDAIAKTLNEVTDKFFFGMSTNVTTLVDLNIKLNKNLLIEEEYTIDDLSAYPNYFKFKNSNYRRRIDDFVREMSKLLMPIELPDVSKLPKDFVGDPKVEKQTEELETPATPDATDNTSVTPSTTLEETLNPTEEGNPSIEVTEDTENKNSESESTEAPETTAEETNTNTETETLPPSSDTEETAEATNESSPVEDTITQPTE